VILSANGLLPGPVFIHHLGSVGGPLARIFFLAAVVSLLCAVLVSIIGVLMPQSYRGLGRNQLSNFTSSQGKQSRPSPDAGRGNP
jgi:hypothetical protein